MFELSELDRRLANMIRIGTVAEVDHVAHKLKIKLGDIITAWRPQPAEVGKNYIKWHPVRLGQQVIVASPSGDLAQCVVVGMLYLNSTPPPSGGENRDVIEFIDGTRVVYDSAAKHLSATLPPTGTVTISADGGVKIKGDVTIEGGLTTTKPCQMTGDLTIIYGDIKADDISLKDHRHKPTSDLPNLTTKAVDKL